METSRSTIAWRMGVITLVIALAVFGICSEPTGMVNARWWLVFFVSKLIGAAFAILAVYLFKKWEIKNIME